MKLEELCERMNIDMVDITVDEKTALGNDLTAFYVRDGEQERVTLIYSPSDSNNYIVFHIGSHVYTNDTILYRVDFNCTQRVGDWDNKS